MADIVSKAVRSRMMSGIRSKNTSPEMIVRKGLFSLGYRFRIHDRRLPGKPDITLPRYRAVVMIHGCFWHGHSCHLFKWPSSNSEFWKKKIEGNRITDAKNLKALKKQGWRVITVWECAFRGLTEAQRHGIIKKIAKWISSHHRSSEIASSRRVKK